MGIAKTSESFSCCSEIPVSHTPVEFVDLTYRTKCGQSDPLLSSERYRAVGAVPEVAAKMMKIWNTFPT